MLSRNKQPTPLETVTTRTIESLNDYDPSTEEFGKILERVEKLHEMRQDEKSSAQVSPDTKATIAANLLGIGMIIGFERANVITSKALGFILRAR
jgi:hypothetical protein